MSLPKLPGYSIHAPLLLDAGAHSKKQTLTFKNGYAVPASMGTGAVPASAASGSPATAQPGQETRPPPAQTCSPKWIEYDNKVLRFFAYFVEQVPDAPEEPWRARKATLLFYMADDTLQVDEPRQGNSGLPQGTLLKRHLVPKDGGGHLAPRDFVVGGVVRAYGRDYHVVDADAFTREFGEAQGLRQPAPLPYPVSPLELHRAERSKPSGLSRADDESPSRFAEALLGKAPPGKKLQQFLEHSSQVLCFFCVWDDRRNLYGDRRHFKLHFFLEDGTLEVLEVATRQGDALGAAAGESGASGPAFLRRSQLPKASSGMTLGACVPPEMCVGPADLRIGGFLSVHGRDFLIYAADGFTRSWYQEKLGSSGEEMEGLEVSEPAMPLPTLQLPPHNGFGSPEDTQQNCVRLVPQPPKKDIYKLMNRDRIVLRFSCKLQLGAGQRLINIDQERRFVLSYFMADDTLSVYEPPVRNTGIAGGKYLERRRVYRPQSTTEWYLETDLFVGALLAVHGRVFELLAADEFTFEYMHNNRHVFEMADPAAALRALKAQLAGRSTISHSLLGAAERQGGSVTSAQFVEAVRAAGASLTAHQAIAIFRKCSKGADGMPASALLQVVDGGAALA